MRSFDVIHWVRGAVAALIFVVCGASAAPAQVVAIVNGTPITALDIEQRIKLEQMTTQKALTRDQVLKILVDDRLKVAIGKRYTYEISEGEIDDTFGNMARRARMTPEQLTQMLNARGIGVNAFRSKIRADVTWQQMVRSRFSSSLQVGDGDISGVLQSRGMAEEKDTTSYTYVLYPVIVIIPAGSSEGIVDARRRETENLRGRFLSCGDGLKIARSLRDVAVREPITRSSSELTPQLRELLDKLELGRLTTPEVTSQGLQMFALCDKKQVAGADSPAKREIRDEIFNKRFEVESKKWLEELRRQAMIEYR